MGSRLVEHWERIVSACRDRNPYLPVGLAVLGVLALDYVGVLQFQIRTLNALKTQVITLESDLRDVHKNRDRLPELQTEDMRLQERLRVLKSRSPAKDEIPFVIEKVSRLASRRHLEIVQILSDTARARTEVEENGLRYVSLPVVMELRGGYHDFGRFLAALEQEDLIRGIRRLSVTAVDQDPLRHAVEVTLDVIYHEDETEGGGG